MMKRTVAKFRQPRFLQLIFLGLLISVSSFAYLIFLYIHFISQQLLGSQLVNRDISSDFLSIFSPIEFVTVIIFFLFTLVAGILIFVIANLSYKQGFWLGYSRGVEEKKKTSRLLQ